MALYVIGDLHLSFSNNKPMDVFGPLWKNHAEKLQAGFSEVKQSDTTVVCGDLTWAMNLNEAEADFKFIDSLPGKKIILKGNHDYWWTTASKAYRFFAEKEITSIEVLNNNCFMYEDKAICGTRGWFYEEETGAAHDAKIMRREILRLETSLKLAEGKEIYTFLHYPPIYQNYRCSEILELFDHYHVAVCCYGHLHGKSCRGAYHGLYHNTEYKLVSADHLNFKPVKLID